MAIEFEIANISGECDRFAELCESTVNYYWLQYATILWTEGWAAHRNRIKFTHFVEMREFYMHTP